MNVNLLAYFILRKYPTAVWLISSRRAAARIKFLYTHSSGESIFGYTQQPGKERLVCAWRFSRFTGQINEMLSIQVCVLVRLVTICYIWASLWENRIFAHAKTKPQISFAVTAKLISAFVFATRIVQSLYFLNPKFQASSHLMWMHSLVCVGPGRKPRRPGFSQRGSYLKNRRLIYAHHNQQHPLNPITRKPA